MATTLVKVRCLQQKLYSRSKQRPEEKFYSLYDKLYRPDILREAYARCRANKGGAGSPCVSIDVRSTETKSKAIRGRKVNQECLITVKNSKNRLSVK